MSNICQVKQKSDSMVCTHCNLAWDVNDKNPPDCEFDLHFEKPKVSTLRPTMQLRYVKTNFKTELQQLHIDIDPTSPVSKVWVNVPIIDITVG